MSAYPWGDDFQAAWQTLGRGKEKAPAYRQLLTGLTAVHGQPTRVITERGLSDEDRRRRVKGMLVTMRPFDPFHLDTCLQKFERMITGDESRDQLSRLLLPAETDRPFEVNISQSGTASAPGWLYEAATWNIMRQLTGDEAQLDLGGRRLALYLDTDGSAVGWNVHDLLSRQWGDRTGYAMLRITARIVTLPEVPDLCIVFDAHLSRLADHWRGIKSTWLQQRDLTQPILRLRVRHIPADDGHGKTTWRTVLANHAAAIAETCGLDHLNIDDGLTSKPGRVRPLVPGPVKHPIGKGPGARLMLRLAEHIQRRCSDLEPLRYDPVPSTALGRRPVQTIGVAIAEPDEDITEAVITDDIICHAVTAAGQTGLRLICLYSTSEARARMAAHLASLSPQAAPTRDGVPSWVNSQLVVSFHHVPKLLEHGPHSRQDLVGEIALICEQTDHTVIAWVETEYDPRTGSPVDDAKNPVRGILAELGIASQFLATRDNTSPAPRARTRRPKAPDADAKDPADHPAIKAAADLMLRTTGILHPTLTKSILGNFLSHGPHSTVHLVGVHVRLQQSGSNKVPPRLVVTAADIQAFADTALSPVTRMWSDKQQQWAWQPHAIADFHSGRIGSTDRGRSDKKAIATRTYIETILDHLPLGPVVLFLDSPSVRTIYPGLQNDLFTHGALPAITLSRTRDVAIIRCNTSDEVGRPVDRIPGTRRSDRFQPSPPDRRVYRLPGTRTWLLPKSSRAYRSWGGALGARYTPWTLPDNLAYKIEEDWHAYTATEIIVVQPGCWTELELVLLTARLCDRTINWDDRTLAPMPLHLSSRADITHPDYRADDDDGGA